MEALFKMKKIIASIITFAMVFMMNIAPASAAIAYSGPICTLTSIGDSCSLNTDSFVQSLSVHIDSNLTGTLQLNGVLTGGTTSPNIPLWSQDGQTEYISGVTV
jgi:hypothetical protein